MLNLFGWGLSCLRYSGQYETFLKPKAKWRDWAMRGLAAAHRRYRIPQKRMVAVVGSLGKSTATGALRAVLLDEDPGQFSLSNHGSWLAGNVLHSPADQTHEVLEVGIDGPGQMIRYAKMLAPDVVVATAIASDHHRSLPTLEHTRDEKAEMLRALRPEGHAIINGDDPHVVWMGTQTDAQVTRFGLSEAHDVWADEIRLEWPRGVAFRLRTPQGSRAVRSRLLGRHLIYPLLAAAAAGLVEGRELDDIARRLESVTPAPGRLEVTHLTNGAAVVDDSFKAGRESYEAAADVFASLPAGGRRIAVLGDIVDLKGPRGDAYRELGRRFGGCADLILYVGGSRNLQPLRAAARQLGFPADKFILVRGGVEECLQVLDELKLGAGDILLLKAPHIQKLRRLVLLLQGREVGCQAATCRIKSRLCEHCPLLLEDTRRVRNPLITRFITHRDAA